MENNTAEKINLFGPESKVARSQPKELDEAKSVIVEAQKFDSLEAFDAEGKKAVSQTMLNVRDMIKLVKDHHEPIKRAAKHAHSVACQKEKDALAPLEQSLNRLQTMLNNCANAERLIEQERQQEADRKAQEKANERRKAAEEMIAGLMESADSLAAQISTLEELLDDDETTHDEAQVARRKLGILRAQQEGNEQELAMAQREVEEAANPVYEAPPIEPKNDQVKGLAKGTKVEVEVVSLKELAAAVGRGDVPEAALRPAAGKIKSYARDGMKLPGCRITTSAQITVRK